MKPKYYDTNDVRNVRARSRAIGRELRRRLEPVVQEPIPNDMLHMLEMMRAIEDRGRK